MSVINLWSNKTKPSKSFPDATYGNQWGSTKRGNFERNYILSVVFSFTLHKRICWSFLSGNFTMEQMEEKIGDCISCEQTCAADLKVREYYNYPPKKSREKINLSSKTWKKIIGQNISPIPSLNVSGRSLILSEKNKVRYQDNQNQNHAVPITLL